MMSLKGARAGIFMLALFAAVSAQAATLLDETQLVATSPAYLQAAPVARALVISAAGKYTLALKDLKTPAAFTTVGVVITNKSLEVARIDAAALNDSATVDFDAQPGTYQVQVLGVPAAQSAGTFSVTVSDKNSAATVLQTVDGMADIAVIPTTQATLNTTFPIASAGTYQISFTDRGFPAALNAYNLAVIGPGGGAPIATLATGQTSVSLVAASSGTYALVVISQASSTAGGGLFSLDISGGPSATTVYSATTSVGTVPAPTPVTIPAAGTYTFSLTDLAFPAALSSVRALIVQNSSGATLSGAGSSAFVAASGPASLYSIATANPTPGAGSYGVQLTLGADTIYSVVYPVQVTDVSNLSKGFVYHVNLPGSGAYRLTLTDFGFPQTFTSIEAAVSQAGTVIGKLNAPGGVDVQAAAGGVDVVVAAVRTSASANGLFGLSLAQGTAVALQQTQGIGNLFSTRKITVPTAGKYEVTVTDHKIPVAFGDLAMAVTRGTALIGQIFGTGKFSFDATPGDYSLNLIATAAPSANYAMYGTQVADAPPAPTLTFSANPATIAAQQTTTLTWSTNGATSCTASGGWSGTKDVNGTFVTSALAADTSYTLNCTGAGGSTSSAVTVKVTAAAASRGGGGTISEWMILVLGSLSLWRIAAGRRRR